MSNAPGNVVDTSQPKSLPAPGIQYPAGASAKPGAGPVSPAGTAPKNMTPAELDAKLATYVGIDDYSQDPSHKYNFRGYCTKCGWQTYQMVKQAAADLVKSHAQRHLMGA